MVDRFTSESGTPGHPDKVADQICGSTLDVVLADDAAGRVAAETERTDRAKELPTPEAGMVTAGAASLVTGTA